jgi:hypothetical protein
VDRAEGHVAREARAVTVVYGCRQSDIVAPCIFYRAPAAQTAGVDLAQFVDRLRDQRARPDCVGHGFMAGIHLANKGQGTRGSARGAYTGARVRERVRRGVPLLDDGCMPVDAIASLFEAGMYPEDALDADDAAFTAEDTWDEEQDLAIVEESGIAAIAAENRAADMESSIAAFWPAVFGMPVDASYETYDGSSVWSGLTGPILGRHMQVAVSFDPVLDAFKVLGSWGASFGRGGYALIARSFIQSALVTDVYSIRSGPVFA